LSRSRLASLELGFGPRLLLRRLTRRLGPRFAARWGSLAPRLGPRLTARWRSLAPRLGARWRGLSAPPLFRGRAALRFHRPRGLGPIGLLGPIAPLGTGLVPVLGLIRPIATIGLPGPVAMIGLIGPIAMIGLVGPAAVPAIVVPLVR
jgi:hypothetical protein